MATQDATDAGANFMLDALGKTVTPAADTIYVGLSSTTPTKAGANVTVPAAGDYVRAAVTFGVASARKRTNTTLATFTSGATAATSAGTMTHATFYSASSGGTFYAFTQLSQPLVWTGGLPVTMAVGDVSLEFETV